MNVTKKVSTVNDFHCQVLPFSGEGGPHQKRSFPFRNYVRKVIIFFASLSNAKIVTERGKALIYNPIHVKICQCCEQILSRVGDKNRGLLKLIKLIIVNLADFLSDYIGVYYECQMDCTYCFVYSSSWEYDEWRIHILVIFPVNKLVFH